MYCFIYLFICCQNNPNKNPIINEDIKNILSFDHSFSSFKSTTLLTLNPVEIIVDINFNIDSKIDKSSNIIDI